MKSPAMSGSTRTIWIMALTAVLSLGAGLGLSRMITSPADAAANAAPPAAGPITVPVELRSLKNDVVLRGDAVYEDPASVTLETGDIGGAAIVTGQVPEVGATLDSGDVMLEVGGRPVILLTGELPVYRTLRVGVSGPDVLQLKTALNALGIPHGDTLSPAYDAATATAVEALYARVGYPAPSAGEEARDMLDGARDMVRSAEEQLASAEREAAQAASGGSTSERVQAAGDADVAYIELAERRDYCATAEAGDQMCLASEIKRLEVALQAAIARRDEAAAAPDTSGAWAAVTAAQRALGDAREELAEAQLAVVTPLPASEVVYLSSAPRRVDDVAVKRGSAVAGTPVMSVSGASLQIAGTVSTNDAELITAGSPVVITMPDDTELPGTVQSVGEPAPDAPAASSSDRKRVVVVPDALTEEQRALLQGANVRMTIPVSSTEGDVLAVPTAALTAGPGGEARVEVLAEDGTSTLVTVTTGLAADGFVEVTPTDGTLEVGDRVVVGTSAEPETDEETEEPDEPSDTEPEESEESSGG